MVGFRGLLAIAAAAAITACAAPAPTPGSSTSAGPVAPSAQPGPPDGTSGQASPPPAAQVTPTLALPDSLSTAELHQRLDPFTPGIERCALPCYNGLLVGQAGLAEAFNFYARLGIGIPDLMPGDYAALQDGEGHLRAFLNKASDQVEAEAQGIEPSLVDLGIAASGVQYLYVGWQYYPGYVTLPRIEDALGLPGRLDLGLVFGDDPPSFVMVLYYPQAQTGFAFYGETLGDASARQVCLSADQVSVIFMGIFAPDIPPMEGLTDSEYLLPLEAAVGVSPAAFADTIRAGQCLSIPAESWGAWESIGG
jgi:hypothetical protein